MALVLSSVLVGVEIVPVRIEAVCSPGFSGLHLLGLPGDVSREARERVRVALEACGIRSEEKRITVQVHADAPLRSARSPLPLLDFALAASVMIALRESDDPSAPPLAAKALHFHGALTLTGGLETRDVFPFLEAVAQYVPSDHVMCVPRPIPAQAPGLDSPLRRGRTFTGLRAFQAWLADACPAPFSGPWPLPARVRMEAGQGGEGAVTHEGDELELYEATFEARFEAALRGWWRHPRMALGLTLALAGRFNVMLMGSPGIGKTHAARTLATLLPPLAPWERAARRLILAAGDESGSPHVRPFRSPHHSCSVAGLVGNASLAPGEFTLAHRGVLFLDEFLEFARTRTESLREPLEGGRVSLARARGCVSLPADFQLVAASNPCRCGNFFSARRACRCAPRERMKALESLSGPLLDRFHLRFLVDDPSEARARGPDPLVAAMEEALRDGNAFARFARRVRETAMASHRDPDAFRTPGFDPGDPIYEPDPGGRFPNMRARVHWDRLLGVARSVFPDAFGAFPPGTVLDALSALRSLDATLENLLLYDAPHALPPRAPEPSEDGKFAVPS